jgi:hypothetical protein
VVPSSAMGVFRIRSEPLPAGAALSHPTDQASDALEVGSALYQLALKYWSEGRPHDAKRVGLQALRVLRGDPSAAELIAGIEATLAEIAHDLDRGGQPHPVNGKH